MPGISKQKIFSVFFSMHMVCHLMLEKVKKQMWFWTRNTRVISIKRWIWCKFTPLDFLGLIIIVLNYLSLVVFWSNLLGDLHLWSSTIPWNFCLCYFAKFEEWRKARQTWQCSMLWWNVGNIASATTRVSIMSHSFFQILQNDELLGKGSKESA